MKKRSHKYNIDKLRPRQGHKYTKYQNVSKYDVVYIYSAKIVKTPIL